MRSRRVNADHGEGVSKLKVLWVRQSPGFNCCGEKAWQGARVVECRVPRGHGEGLPRSRLRICDDFRCPARYGRSSRRGLARPEVAGSEGDFHDRGALAGDSLAENLNPIGRVYYGFSTMVCTPTSLSQEVGLALGAQAGERRLREVLSKGGFTRFRRATETPFNMILEARP